MLYKYGKCMHNFFLGGGVGVFFLFLKLSFLYFGGVFNKTIIPLALVGYEMIVANSALCASLAILPSHIQHTLVD